MRQFSLFPTPLGACGIAWHGDAVVATQLPEETPAATAARMAARTGGSEGTPPPHVRRAIALMTALLEGSKDNDLTGITCHFGEVRAFDAEVYAVTRTIPAGETQSYGAIALRLGDKRLARNVGRALGRNPLPIIVPCHRVMGADGRLTGFSAYGGVETKLRMLAIEGARIGETPGLFDDLPWW